MEPENIIANDINTSEPKVDDDLFSSESSESQQRKPDAGLTSYGSSAVTNDLTVMDNAARTDAVEVVTEASPGSEKHGLDTADDASNKGPTEPLEPPREATANIAPKLEDEDKKPVIASIASKQPIPKTYSEACDGDKLVLYMRQNGESRARMASAWSIVMGSKMTETNIGSRLSRIDGALAAVRPQHECAIIKAVDEVEREAEEAKWGNVASKVLRAVGWKYPALSLKDKYAAMRKSGFAYIASNPNNSQPTQQTLEYPMVAIPQGTTGRKIFEMEDSETEDDQDDGVVAGNRGGGSKRTEVLVNAVKARQKSVAAGKTGREKKSAAASKTAKIKPPKRKTPVSKLLGTGKGGMTKKSNTSRAGNDLVSFSENLDLTRKQKRESSISSSESGETKGDGI